jgi:small subunit ribosomal protein S20
VPIKQAAKKYLRASKKRAARNLAIKKTFKDAVKKLRELAAAGKTDEAKEMFPTVQKALDKAAKGNIISKNTAARKKSRLAAMMKKSTK